MRDPASLSDDDREIFFLFVTRLVGVFETVVEHHQLGSLPDERVENYRNFMLRFLRTPGGQAWIGTNMYSLSAKMSKALEVS